MHGLVSPNQVLTHAARAAAKQLNKVPFQVVKPARLHFARTARALRDATCVSEASCPNFEPRAHARLTGLTTFQAPLVAARGAREGLWLEQWPGNLSSDNRLPSAAECGPFNNH